MKWFAGTCSWSDCISSPNIIASLARDWWMEPWPPASITCSQGSFTSYRCFTYTHAPKKHQCSSRQQWRSWTSAQEVIPLTSRHPPQNIQTHSTASSLFQNLISFRQFHFLRDIQPYQRQSILVKTCFWHRQAHVTSSVQFFAWHCSSISPTPAYLSHRLACVSNVFPYQILSEPCSVVAWKAPSP